MSNYVDKKESFTSTSTEDEKLYNIKIYTETLKFDFYDQPTEEVDKLIKIIGKKVIFPWNKHLITFINDKKRLICRIKEIKIIEIRE